MQTRRGRRPPHLVFSTRTRKYAIGMQVLVRGHAFGPHHVVALLVGGTGTCTGRVLFQRPHTSQRPSGATGCGEPEIWGNGPNTFWKARPFEIPDTLEIRGKFGNKRQNLAGRRRRPTTNVNILKFLLEKYVKKLRGGGHESSQHVARRFRIVLKCDNFIFLSYACKLESQ